MIRGWKNVDRTISTAAAQRDIRIRDHRLIVARRRDGQRTRRRLNVSDLERDCSRRRVFRRGLVRNCRD